MTARIGLTDRLPRSMARAGPLIAVVVLSVLAWPIANGPASASLDESWQIALQMAAGLRLRPGVDIVFTYGPLGFLGYPHPYVGLTSALALVASLAVYTALIGMMFYEARRVLPIWAAFVVTLLVARILVSLPPWESFQALALLCYVEILADRVPWSPTIVAAVAGALAGAATLGKTNVGIVVVLLGMVALTLSGRAGWKAVGLFAVSAAASSAGLFILAGGHPEDIGAYLGNAYQVIAGYNGAMGGDVAPTRAWLFIAVAFAAVVLAWAGWSTSRTWTTRRRCGLVVLSLVFGFAMWKTLVVREHATFVLATAVIAMFCLGAGMDRRTWLAGILAIGMAFAGSSGINPQLYLDVVGSTRSLAAELADAFVPGRATRAADHTREQLRTRFAIDPGTLSAVGDATVHIDPTLTSVAFAYPSLHWQPLPVFQSYVAYTSKLDQLDAGVLRSPSAPQRILRSFRLAPHSDRLHLWIGRVPLDSEVFPTMVDGRFRWFESPAQTLETFCRYVQVSATDRWQVLARTDRSCGAPEPLATVSARGGDPVVVPVETRPDRFVILRIHGLDLSPLGAIRAALAKPRDLHITLDDTRYRLIPGTALDGLLLRVPSVADGTGVFAFGPPIGTITVKGVATPLTFEFLSVPLQLP